MAKKNSSKTATEKAIQASEPRVMTYRGWQGVNFIDAPLTWKPLETTKSSFRQTDLPDNYLMVQNNLVTTETLGLETRPDSLMIGGISSDKSNFEFTGVSGIYKKWLFCVVRESRSLFDWTEYIWYKSLVKPYNKTEEQWRYEWEQISLRQGDTDNPDCCEICEIGFFEGNIVATIKGKTHWVGMELLTESYLAMAKIKENSSLSIKGMDWQTGTESLENRIVDTPKIKDPSGKLTLSAVGMKSGSSVSDEHPVRIEVCYCYTNRLGSTLTNAKVDESNIATLYTEYSPALWTSKRYVRISPQGIIDADILTKDSSASGIDFYAREQENLDWVFIGHIDLKKSDSGYYPWGYDWYGNMTDISQWLTAQLMVPTENTTRGPDATHFACHDSRIYYWGMPDKPYRLWIGGNPGSEFSVARGLGGAWVDIEPGSGFDIMGTAKWKTVSGANIVTIMCGNRNTTKVKRFNLVETNLTITNEVAYKSYMYEEVSNVVGCNSRWGYGVFSDGLYSLSRYGLMLTTMAMEYNSQMKNQSMSEVIAPIFTERLGSRLRDSRLVCINDMIYIVLSESGATYTPTKLDNVIICYDMNLKAWYTWTHDQTLDSEMQRDPDNILHIMAIDSDEYIEGLGTITKEEVRLYPTTGIQDPKIPKFQVIMETGELIPRMPAAAFWYIQQLEFRFDYYLSDPDDPPTILVEGVDYYGRFFSIEKKLNIKSRGNHGDKGMQRNYVEWIRVEKYVESLRIRLKGKARFRLTHINSKMYQQADTIGTPYGFDAHDTYRNRSGREAQIHHYIDDYNNLRRAIVS